jgi:hypothetical protein
LIIVLLDLGVATQRYNHGNPYWIGNSLAGNERQVCYAGNQRELGNENITPFFSREPYLNTYSRFYNPKIIKLAKQPETEPFLLKLAYFFPAEKDERFKDLREKGNNDAIKSVKLCPNNLAVDLEAETPGRVVWTDSWAPGWKATVNGSQRTVGDDYGLFKGVEVPAGRSTVFFFYSPVYLIPGLISLIVGIVILAGLTIWIGKRSRRNSLL